MSPKPVQITFVIQKLFGLKGGAERVFLETAREFQRRGHKVRILVFDGTQGSPAYESDAINIKDLFPKRMLSFIASRKARNNQTPNLVKKAPHSGLMGHLKWSVTHGLFERRLKNALKTSSPDLVIAFLPPAITASVRAAKALQIPVVASTHNLPEEDFGDSPRWDQNPLYRRRARKALENADAVTVLQPEFLSWFPESMYDRLEVLPNPIQRISSPGKKAIPRENIILGVGRLTKVKRFDILIAAWEKLHTEFPNWSVKIYGEGPCKDALQKQIEESRLQSSIELKGISDKLGHIFDKARVLCHPSSFEGFGLVIAEAMAHGVPAVAFDDCPGANSLISDKENGLLISRGSNEVAMYSNGLRQLLNSPDQIDHLGNTATEITQKFPVKEIYDRWEKLVRKLA